MILNDKGQDDGVVVRDERHAVVFCVSLKFDQSDACAVEEVVNYVFSFVCDEFSSAVVSIVGG